MPRKKAEKPPTLRSLLARSPELKQVSRRLSVLALAQAEQEGKLGVRQREQLRRALAAAGDELGWAGTGRDESLTDINKSVLSLAKAGAKAMVKDLADELADKKTEVAQLGATMKAVRKLADLKKTTYPQELSYTFTARDGSQGLITKTEELVLNDADEANSAGDRIERSLPGREKLADLMVVDLKLRAKKLDAMTKALPDFVKGTTELLRDVLVTLQ